MRSSQDTGIMGIGQAAAASGLSADTLRYYERESLIGPIRRASNGQRQYSSSDIAWIGVVTCLREAGLGIGDLQQFTRLLREASDTTTRVEFLRARRSDLMQRVQQLQAAMEVLDESALPNAPVVRPSSPATNRRRGGTARLRVATAAVLRRLADRLEPRRVVAAPDTEC